MIDEITVILNIHFKWEWNYRCKKQKTVFIIPYKTPSEINELIAIMTMAGYEFALIPDKEPDAPATWVLTLFEMIGEKIVYVRAEYGR